MNTSEYNLKITGAIYICYCLHLFVLYFFISISLTDKTVERWVLANNHEMSLQLGVGGWKGYRRKEPCCLFDRIPNGRVTLWLIFFPLNFILILFSFSYFICALTTRHQLLISLNYFWLFLWIFVKHDKLQDKVIIAFDVKVFIFN